MSASRWQIAAAAALVAGALVWAFWPGSAGEQGGSAGGSSSSSSPGGGRSGARGGAAGTGVAGGALGEAVERGGGAAGLSGSSGQAGKAGQGKVDPSKAIYLWGRTVQKGNGEPVPLAQVTVLSAPPKSVEIAHATSDTLGRFRIDGLQTGHYRVKAQAGGFTMNPVRVEAFASKEVKLELFAASYIEGQVVTGDGKPAAGAEVFAVGADDSATTTATDTGTFSLEVAPRSWMVAARRGDESGKADAPVTVTAGATARGVKIKLGAAAGLSGVVVAATGGQGVPGAQVAVSPHNLNGNSGAATTDGNGNFSVKGLAPGSYDVDVTASGWVAANRRGVTVQEGQKFSLRVELHRTGTIEGVVRDAAQHPVPGGVVRTVSEAPVETRADASGAYRLTGVPSGRSQFAALRDGSLYGAVAGADVPEGGSAHLDFELKDEGVVSGHVRRKDGTPAPQDAQVSLLAMGDIRIMGSGVNAIPIDAAGAFAASVPAGSYATSIQRPSRGPAFRQRTFVTVEAGKTATVELVWTDPADDAPGFGGIVLEPGGTPSPGASVNVSHFERGAFFSAVTDENGRFRVDRPRTDFPETFGVRASNGGRLGSAPVAAGQTDITIPLLPAATLRGHLAGGGADSFRVEVGVKTTGEIFTPRGPQTLEFTGDRFEVTDVPGMPVHVMVVTADGRSAQVDVPLSPGAVQDVEIPLQPLGIVTGRVIDAATQQPLPDVNVEIESALGAPDEGVFTAGDGRFRLRTAAGKGSLDAFQPRYKAVKQAFSIEAGQSIDLGDLAMTLVTAQPGTIGAMVRGDSETRPMIFMIIPGSPADLAGLRPGDQVVAVDGAPVTGVSDATSRIKGAPGTPVQLAVSRSGTALAFTINRAP